MGFFTSVTAIMIVLISTSFVLLIIKMSMSHHEKIMRIKYGIPLNDEARKDDFVNYSTKRMQ